MMTSHYSSNTVRGPVDQNVHSPEPDLENLIDEFSNSDKYWMDALKRSLLITGMGPKKHQRFLTETESVVAANNDLRSTRWHRC